MMSLVFLAVASATPVVQAPPATSLCVGRKLEECVNAIKTFQDINQETLDSSLSKIDEVDINGKPISKRRFVYFFAGPKGRHPVQMVDIDLTPDNLVKSITMSINSSVRIAKTLQDYRDTDLLDKASSILSADCWNGDPSELFRWFENKVKPSIVPGATERETNWQHTQESTFSKTPKIPYCGVNVTFTLYSGHDTDDISEENPTGVFSMADLTIEM